MAFNLYKVLRCLSIGLRPYLSIGIIIFFILFNTQQPAYAQTRILSIYPGPAGKADLPKNRESIFEHYSTESGLSSDLVFKILKDKYGFLWFATQNGLNRFNAYNFVVYENDPQNGNSISLNDVSAICEHDGNIWAGTWGGGLNKFNRADKFTHYYNVPRDFASISDNKIQFLFRDHYNTLWVCTQNGLDKYNSAKNSFEHFSTDKRVIRIAEDKQGNLYLGSMDGLYILDSDRKTLHKYKLPPELLTGQTDSAKAITAIYLDHNNTAWIGTQKGLVQFELKTGKFTKLKSLGYSFPKDVEAKYNIDKVWITCILEDSFGNIWAGSLGQGLFKIDVQNKNITDFHNYLKDQYSIKNYDINDLQEDNSNLLWIATNHGVFRLNLKPPKFRIFSLAFENKTVTGFAPAFCFLGDNTPAAKNPGNKVVWIGTINGINKFELASSKSNYIQLPDKLKSDINIVITTIFKDNKGNLWLGASEPGLHIYDPQKKQFIEGKGYYSFTNKVKDIIVFQILKDNENNIWLTSNKGLYRFNIKSGSWSVYKKTNDKNSLIDNNLRTLYKDNSGILWIGTIDSGLSRFDYKKNQFTNFRYSIKSKNSLSNDYVSGICEDSLSIWAGTPNGLNRIDKKNLQCTRYFRKNSFASKFINGILMDGHGNLWISTNKGISLFNTSDSSTINFDNYDGLNNSTFIRRATYTSSQGEMFFGNGQGFISFHPDSMQFNKHIPPIYLTKFAVMGKDRNTENSLEGLKEVTLNYNENFIQFEFATLDYTAPLKNQYKYKLDGFDNDWISAGTRRFVSYTSLKSGTYIFRVIGSNDDGYWNTKGLAIKIIVIPPYWQTFWFRVIATITVLLVLFIFYKSKVKDIEKREKQLETLNKQLLMENKERQKAELEMKKAKESAENADRLKSEFLAQISHEIRTPINAILSFSGLIREDVADFLSEDMRDGFSIIDRSSKRLIRTVDLILNMSLLQTDSFELNFQSFDLYKKVLEKKITEYSITAQERGLKFNAILDTDDCLIYADETTVHQIFDNLLDNAIKFTKKGGVGIHIYRDDMKRLVVKIFDTGIGISEEYLPNLFTPFSQEEGGYSRRFEGNGLGLALTKKYVELNKAYIHVQSVKGKGSNFVITFPAYQ